MALGLLVALCAVAACLLRRHNMWVTEQLKKKAPSSKIAVADVQAYERLEEGEQMVELVATAPSSAPGPVGATGSSAFEPEASGSAAAKCSPSEAHSLPPASTADTAPLVAPDAPPDAAPAVTTPPVPTLPSATAPAESDTSRPLSSRMREYSRGNSSARASNPARGCSSARASSPARGCTSARGGSPAKKDPSKSWAFNSTNTRRDHSPAPGDYNTDAHTLAVLALKSHNKSIARGKGSFMTNLHDDRSSPSLTSEGDPTAYSDYHLEKASLGACSRQSSNSKVREGQIGFNSKVARCVDASFDDRTPLRGPGSYNYHHLYGCAMDPGATKSGTTAFTNTAPLCGYVRKIDTPGAGDYRPEPAEGNSYSKLGTSAFAGNSARCASQIATAGQVGPESYDQDHHSITRMLASKRNPRLPPFNASGARLGS